MKGFIAVGLVIMFSSLEVYSQNFEINNETVTTCGGSFLDDNGGVGDIEGTSGQDYTNTSYTYTICPDNPGDVISVDFALFNLYQSANPNNSDYLAVFDGDNTGESSLGSYTGNAAQGLSISGTVNNTSGCLTFVFNPSSVSPGTFAGWEAIISCTTPCANPTSISTIASPIPDMNNSVSVCLNEPITFEDAGSFAETGFTIEDYIWNFDDGTITTGEANVEHSFSEPGEYIVTLTVEDNNGCQNLNLTPLQVLVSTVPIFNTNFSSEICLGGEGYVNGNPVQSQTWTSLPPQVVAGETYLPDDAGASYTSELVFDFFEEGQTLDDCSDLLELTINMEHSYMGDLQIQINCPSGNTVTLVEFGDGGGGTFLGEALDDGTLDPGIGYNYSWAPDATNGNWGDNSDGVDILPEGTYESTYDMCDLVGCELNGEWTIEIIDNLLADNGYIFEWGINFEPEIMPGITTFTPTIGLGIDSTSVTGPHVINTTNNGNFLDIQPPELGEYEYIFTASNNFGCTFDTTVVVEVVNGAQIILPEEIGFCGTEFILEPEIINEFDQGPCEYTIVLANDNNTNFNNHEVSVSIDNVFSQVLTSGADSIGLILPVPSGSLVSFDYSYGFWGASPGNYVLIYDDTDNLIFDSGTNLSEGEIFSDILQCGSNGQLVYEWTPALGLDSPNFQVTSGENNIPTTYTLNVETIGFAGCNTSAEVFVFPETVPDLGEDAEITVCQSSSPFSMFDQLGGTPENEGTWFDSSGNEVDDLFEPSIHPSDNYVFAWTGQNCPELETNLDVVVDVLTITSSIDTTICQNGAAELSISYDQDVGDDVNVVWNGGLFNGQSIQVQPLVSPTLYEVQVFYGDNCESNIDSTIVSTLPPLLMQSISDELICLGDSLIASPNNATGGLEPYTFTWTSSNSEDIGQNVVLEPTETTQYCMEFTDACESTPVTECFTIALNEIISSEFTGINTEGCFPITAGFLGTALDESIINNVVWNFGDGATSNEVNSATHTYSEPGIYDVTLTIYGTDGCVYTESNESFIEAYNVPEADFIPEDFNVVLPNNTFSFDNASLDNDFNQWTFDAYGSSSEEDPEFSFPLNEPAELEVQLVASNFNGCSDTVSYTVFINNGFSLYAPTSFTPDGDGINEVWKIEGIDIDESDFQMNIWNRDGETVFTTIDPSVSWDGSHMNGDYYVPNGVYTYQILTRAQTSGDKKKIYGHITVLR